MSEKDDDLVMDVTLSAGDGLKTTHDPSLFAKYRQELDEQLYWLGDAIARADSNSTGCSFQNAVLSALESIEHLIKMIAKPGLGGATLD